MLINAWDKSVAIELICCASQKMSWSSNSRGENKTMISWTSALKVEAASLVHDHVLNTDFAVMLHCAIMCRDASFERSWCQILFIDLQRWFFPFLRVYLFSRRFCRDDFICAQRNYPYIRSSSLAATVDNCHVWRATSVASVHQSMSVQISSVVLFSLFFFRFTEGLYEKTLHSFIERASENPLIFNYHKLNAAAFAACCGPFDASNHTVFQEWIDAYRSGDQQRQMIFDCSRRRTFTMDHCDNALQNASTTYAVLLR